MSGEHCFIRQLAACGGEHLYKLLRCELFLLLALDINNHFALVHHDKTVAVLDGIVHIVRYHERGERVLVDYALGEVKHLCGGFRVEGGCVLVEQQHLWLFK